MFTGTQATPDINAFVADLKAIGYVVVEGDAADLAHDLRQTAQRLFDQPDAHHSDRHPEGWDEVINAAEVASEFLPLLLDPVAVAAAVALFGPDVELASTGEVDRKRPMSAAAHCGWHNDFTWMRYVPRPRPFFWLAAYYFLSDITEASGPVWVMPGTHRLPEEPTVEHNQANGCGRPLAGSVPLLGPAGTMVLLNNEIWHMSTPNTSAESRIIFKAHFKPSWMKPWGHGRTPSQEFAERQTETYARQLLGAYAYDDVPWEYGRDGSSARYPVVQWLASKGLPAPD